MKCSQRKEHKILRTNDKLNVLSVRCGPQPVPLPCRFQVTTLSSSLAMCWRLAGRLAPSPRATCLLLVEAIDASPSMHRLQRQSPFPRPCPNPGGYLPRSSTSPSHSPSTALKH